MSGSETVFAVSTAPGKAGIAVVRVTGPAARRTVEKLAPPLPPPRTAGLRTIRGADGGLIDRGLVLWFEGPRSETGEDMVEFQVHGSVAVTAALLESLRAIPGCRPAQAGEFARRAFENGKLDLTAVEGLADLIDAETAAQRRQAVRQLDGSLGRLYEEWRRRLIEMLALAEAGIDFVEEEIPHDIWDTVRPQVLALASEISRHLADANRGERIRQGATLVIAGPPNAGKSSLMNWLAQRDVAIVSEYPGTTRDAIEVRLDLGGVAVTAIDTAGLREAADAIEEEGIRRAEARIASADLVLWVRDASVSEAEPIELDSPVWHVVNKVDLVDSPPDQHLAENCFRVSVTSERGLDRLLAELGLYFSAMFDPGEDPGITRERHRRELEISHSALIRASQGDYGAMPDVVCEDLRHAANAIGRITGRVDVEDVLDVIFRDFCIGK